MTNWRYPDPDEDLTDAKFTLGETMTADILKAKQLADKYESDGFIDIAWDMDKEELALVIAALRSYT